MAPDPAPESHSCSQAESNFPAYFAIEGEYNQCKDCIDTGNEHFVAIGHYEIKFCNRSQGGNDDESDTNLYKPAIDPDKEEEDRKSTRLNSSHRRLSRMPSSAWDRKSVV